MNEIYFVGDRRCGNQFHYIIPGIEYGYFNINTGFPLYREDIIGFRELKDAKKWKHAVDVNGGWSGIEIFKGTPDGDLYGDPIDDRLLITTRLKDIMTLTLLDYE